jgi:hypothetical protein
MQPTEDPRQGSTLGLLCGVLAPVVFNLTWLVEG